MKKSLLLTKRWLLLGALFLIVGATITPAQAQNNPWGITDNDTLILRPPAEGMPMPIPGNIFNAINPRYIANKHGFTSEFGDDGQEIRWFEIIAFNDTQSCFRSALVSTLTMAEMFNYYINGRIKFFYSRVLVSAIMPQAIERVVFTPTQDNLTIPVGNHFVCEASIKQKGEVRFYTRPIPSASTSQHTLYLLDGVEITSAIFEAIHPIFIRSLQRITDSDFNQSGLQEMVKIETFSYSEIRRDVFFLGNRTGSILLVNGIELPLDTDRKLKRTYFRKHQRIYSGNEGFDELRQRFPEATSVTIITL